MNEEVVSKKYEAESFRGEVLNKVYRVWLIRKFLPILIAEILILTAALYWVGRMVFVEQIFVNATVVFFAHPENILPFVAAAFSHASAIVKILTLLVAVLFALIIRRISQGFLRFILVRQNYFKKVK